MSEHKAGFVNIIGNPNVGKSTLMNAFVGEKLSIITSKAQTTRHRILGIVNGEDFQMILSDTPGIIKPAYELQASMMDFVKSAFEDADILVYMVELGEKTLKDELFFKKLQGSKIPVLLLLNKMDISEQSILEEQIAYWQEQLPNAEIHPISAIHKFNVKEVFLRLVELMPAAPPYYPKDQLTDKPERFFVNETKETDDLDVLEKVIEPEGIDGSFVGDAARTLAASKKSEGLELTLYTKVGMGDGQQANNPWLRVSRSNYKNILG